MLTWGISGRGDQRRAAVFCMGCREVLARDLPVNEAYLSVQKLQPVHQCKKPDPEIAIACSKCGCAGIHACVGIKVKTPTQEDELRLGAALE